MKKKAFRRDPEEIEYPRREKVRRRPSAALVAGHIYRWSSEVRGALYPSIPKRHPVPRQEIRMGLKAHEW
jgi:hypothetical protein